MKWYVLFLIIFGSVFLFLLLIYVFLCLFLSHHLSYPKRYSLKETLDCDIQKGLVKEQLEWKKEEMNLTMKDGYLIHGDYYPNHPNKLLILVHGYTWTRYGGLKYAPIFYQKGYSLYLYDQRSHGENLHKDVTMGKKEADDLHEIILHFRKLLGTDAEIAIHGESMGAAVAIEELKYPDDLSFVIADSPYADLKELLQDKCHQYHLPTLVILGIDLSLRIFHHYSLKDVSPIASLKQSKTKLLLLFGDKDTMVPPHHEQELCQARKENTLLHSFPNVEHTLSYQTYPLEYQSVVESFLNSLS